jgi:hypothetical protein
MLKIPDNYLINIQCQDEHGQIGTFFTSQKTRHQTSETYKSLAGLLLSDEYKFANSHGINILWPGDNTN